MRYRLCCDGGGTKLIALLIDEELNVVASGMAGGVNPNFIPAENIRSNMDACLCAVMSGFEGLPVEACFASMPCPPHLLKEALARAGLRTRVEHISEGRMGLLAGICSEEGFAALSGTGSDVFYIGPAGLRIIGGWGLMLGDEGSGGQIGQRGIIAAIHAYEGRGEPTLLTALLMSWLGQEEGGEPLRTLRESLCPRVYGAASPRAVLASFAPYVSEAWERGDWVAGNILAGAGREMGRQMTALIKASAEEDAKALIMPSTVCGGTWKGSRLIFHSYRDYVRADYPGFIIHWPAFDAVAGGAVLAGLEMGYPREEIKTRMSLTFHDYLYPSE
jgi:N-acetylglucosamine kinase-like BadF-type ATPase